MGGWATPRSMGVSHHDKEKDRQNPFFYVVWFRGDYLPRNKNTDDENQLVW